MANRKQHAVVAAALGLGVYAFRCHRSAERFTLLGALKATAVTVLGGLVPDVLEPALHPNHRSFCHSVSGGGLLAGGAGVASRNIQLGEELTFYAGLFVLGYISHLLLDSTTPKGVPLLC